MTFDAPDAQTAIAAAASRGMHVDSLNPIHQQATVPPRMAPPPMQAYAPAPAMGWPPPAPPPPRKARSWLILLLLVLPFLAPFKPDVPIWSGYVLGALLLLFAIPGIRSGLRPLFRVYPQRPVRGATKLTTLAVYASVLISLGFAGRSMQERERVAAEQKRIEDEKHAKVVAAANQQVTDLSDKAAIALRAKDIDGATKLLKQAQQVPTATNQSTSSKLLDTIQLSNDPAKLREVLIGLNEPDFNAFATSKVTPASLKLGYDVLTDRALAIAVKEIPTARTERELRAKQAAEAAAKAKREAEARAETERRDREAKAAAERARDAAANKEVQDKLDAYTNLLTATKVSVVTNVSVRKHDDMWDATLTVADIWHIKHKQIRLQDAQTLWKAWAAIASPKDPDKAFIKIVDGNGNEVGGSRVWGGSLIWVQD